MQIVTRKLGERKDTNTSEYFDQFLSADKKDKDAYTNKTQIIE